jgi:hypothetical protein
VCGVVRPCAVTCFLARWPLTVCCACVARHSGNQSDAVLHAGDYFGERALLLREPRAADVFAQSDVTLVALAREDFEALLGHLRELLERNIGMRLLACVPIMQLLSTAEVCAARVPCASSAPVCVCARACACSRASWRRVCSV